VQEEASAHIEDNIITGNLLANIAFGGLFSENTIIVNNVIKHGCLEGIFVVESGQCIISRNRIEENLDGIVVATAIPIISKNTILRNKSNGIVALLRSEPLLQNNIIKFNRGVGLFVRDRCIVKLEGGNIIKKN